MILRNKHTTEMCHTQSILRERITNLPYNELKQISIIIIIIKVLQIK